MPTASSPCFLKVKGPETAASGQSVQPVSVSQQTRRSRLYQSFLKNEDGAVTVDWVVLTASIVGLGLIVLFPIAFATENSVIETRDNIVAVDVGYKSATP